MLQQEINLCPNFQNADWRQIKPQFYFTGVDYFVPFFVKQARSHVQRWGCILTCLTTRAVHIEVAPTFSTDSLDEVNRLIYLMIMEQFLLVQKENFVKFNSSVIQKHLLQRNNQWQFKVAPTLSTDSLNEVNRLDYIVTMEQFLLVQKENFVKLYRNSIRP